MCASSIVISSSSSSSSTASGDVGIVGRKRVNPGEASSDSQVVVYSPSDLGVHSSSSESTH